MGNIGVSLRPLKTAKAFPKSPFWPVGNNRIVPEVRGGPFLFPKSPFWPVGNNRKVPEVREWPFLFPNSPF